MPSSIRRDRVAVKSRSKDSGAAGDKVHVDRATTVKRGDQKRRRRRRGQLDDLQQPSTEISGQSLVSLRPAVNSASIQWRFWHSKRGGYTGVNVNVSAKIWGECQKQFYCIVNLHHLWINYPRSMCHVIDLVYEKWRATWGLGSSPNSGGFPHAPFRRTPPASITVDLSQWSHGHFGAYIYWPLLSGIIFHTIVSQLTKFRLTHRVASAIAESLVNLQNGNCNCTGQKLSTVVVYKRCESVQCTWGGWVREWVDGCVITEVSSTHVVSLTLMTASRDEMVPQRRVKGKKKRRAQRRKLPAPSPAVASRYDTCRSTCIVEGNRKQGPL